MVGTTISEVIYGQERMRSFSLATTQFNDTLERSEHRKKTSLFCKIVTQTSQKTCRTKQSLKKWTDCKIVKAREKIQRGDF